MRSDLARLQKVLDAATTFAMELEAPAHPGSTAFGTLDRTTALAALARISGHRSEVLRDAAAGRRRAARARGGRTAQPRRGLDRLRRRRLTPVGGRTWSARSRGSTFRARRNRAVGDPMVGTKVGAIVSAAALLTGALVGAGGGSAVAGAASAIGTVTNYASASIVDPTGLAVGNDGTVWFSNSIPNTIGRRTPAGTFSTTSAGEQEISQMTFQTRPSHMTKRPDGTILYVETGTICCDGLLVGAGIGTITPSGQVQPGTDPGADQSTAPSIDVGTDGTLWIGYPGGCDGVVVFECSELWAGNSIVARNVSPTAVAGGSDGSGWFSDGYLTYVSPQRTLTRFQNPAAVPTGGIEVGDDGNLWFAKGNAIGRITPAGVVTTFTDPTISSPNALVLGPDGNIWFSNNGSASIGRITPAGAVTNYTGTGIDHPTDLAVAPDGGIWFVNQGNHTLGRIQALLPVPPRMAYPTPTTLVGNATFLIAAGAPGTTAIEFRVTGGALHNALVSGATDVGVYGWWGIWGTSTLPAGNYSVVALATDGAGNRGVERAGDVRRRPHPADHRRAGPHQQHHPLRHQGVRRVGDRRPRAPDQGRVPAERDERGHRGAHRLRLDRGPGHPDQAERDLHPPQSGHGRGRQCRHQRARHDQDQELVAPR